MIDIHTHILPGVDDGAPDYDETLAMFALARQDGITAMVATPHANLRYQFDPDRCQRERDRIRRRARWHGGGPGPPDPEPQRPRIPARRAAGAGIAC